jgi:murein DD-endopeptidase MepM/ murein hydrolase activator NlpD
MTLMNVFTKCTLGILVLAGFLFSGSITAWAAEDEVRVITFPVRGEYTYRNDWHEPRGGGTRKHMGTDIIADKMTPLVAAVDGYIIFVARPEARWGNEVEIQGDDGYFYDYLHMNNDTPGTDDGMGGEVNAYMPGVVRGARVSAGQLIGWVGDSGNAEETVPHLHFEIRDSRGVAINPFYSLSAASNGKGVSANAPRTNTVEATWEERKAGLRYIFTKDLSVGSESNEVRRLQATLRALGFFRHPSDTGYFGEVTKTAVIAYQKKKGVAQSGSVGLETRRKLNDDLGTYDPNDYQPFYSREEERALQIQRLMQQIAILQKQLEAMRGGSVR